MAEANKKAPEVELEKLVEIPLPGAVLAAELDKDGKVAYAACQDCGIYEVDLDRKSYELIGRHESYASGIAVRTQGTELISAGYDGRLLWHDIKERKLIRAVEAHDFWCWDMDLSADGRWVASCTGRYEAGGPKYEPAGETEPSVKIFNAATGQLHQSLVHQPPVQAVCFSPDSQHVAAGTLMGDLRVWEVGTGKLVSQWNTPDFTSWGVIKSHHYLGGVFGLTFHPDGSSLYACGMGPMVDPMAGNGVQRWQKFDWRTGKKLDQTHEGESGQGLMEAMVFHPGLKWFAMAGRLFQGQWNLAFFDVATGRNMHALDAKHRITDIRLNSEGSRLLLAKARQQEKKKDGKWPPYGILELWSLRPGSS
ncbi:MAG: hypothetical protein FJ405_11915 [Verrucomicrobia bacterium]|nr:hypothetical protein [Verrucomicrobiota bacterium]